LDQLRVEPASIPPGGNVKVSVAVTNTGDREGDEVPQLYIHQKVSSVARPVLALKGFQRVHLKPGESRNVEFTLTPDDLAIYGAGMEKVVEPGRFEIFVGTSSVTTLAGQVEVKEK